MLNQQINLLFTKKNYTFIEQVMISGDVSKEARTFDTKT
jgi:hypothetical protein